MNKLLYTLIIAVFFSVPVFAAHTGDNVSFTNQSIRKVGDQVDISMDVVVNRVGSNYKLTVTPVLYNGSNQISLKSLQLVGKYRHIADQREGLDSSEDYVMKRKASETIPYRVSIPYADWMSEVSVGVDQLIEGCCTADEVGRLALAEDKLLYYEVVPKYHAEFFDYEFTQLEQYTLENSFLHPMEDYNKRYDLLVKDRDKGTSVAIFTVGSHRLDMGFQGNKDVLDAISRAFKLIEDDPNAILKHIMISGYASPEGFLSL